MTLVVLPEADEIITVNLLPTWHGTQKKLRRKNYKKVAVAATRRRHLANISWHNLDHSQRLITGNQEKTTSLLSLHYKLPGHIKTSVPCFSMLFSFSFSAFSLPWLGGNKALYIFREPYHAGKQKHLVWAKKKSALYCRRFCRRRHPLLHSSLALVFPTRFPYYNSTRSAISLPLHLFLFL